MRGRIPTLKEFALKFPHRESAAQLQDALLKTLSSRPADAPRYWVSKNPSEDG
jgi:hypothetical protein